MPVPPRPRTPSTSYPGTSGQAASAPAGPDGVVVVSSAADGDGVAGASAGAGLRAAGRGKTTDSCLTCSRKPAGGTTAWVGGVSAVSPSSVRWHSAQVLTWEEMSWHSGSLNC